MKHLLVLLAPLMVASSALAAPVEVRRVIDGDTVVLTTGERVRLACMDTPERGVMGAAAATAEFAAWCWVKQSSSGASPPTATGEPLASSPRQRG